MGWPPSSLRCTPVNLTSGSSPPIHSYVLVLAADASDIDLDDMSAYYGLSSYRPLTPMLAPSLTEILLPQVRPKGIPCTPAPARHVHPPPLVSPRPYTSASVPTTRNKTLFFFMLLPTWAVCKIPLSHHTLCSRAGTHDMSSRLSTLLVNTPCPHLASAPGAHG